MAGPEKATQRDRHWLLSGRRAAMQHGYIPKVRKFSSRRRSGSCCTCTDWYPSGTRTAYARAADGHSIRRERPLSGVALHRTLVAPGPRERDRLCCICVGPLCPHQSPTSPRATCPMIHHARTSGWSPIAYPCVNAAARRPRAPPSIPHREIDTCTGPEAFVAAHGRDGTQGPAGTVARRPWGVGPALRVGAGGRRSTTPLWCAGASMRVAGRPEHIIRQCCAAPE
jgi:hypothetical protein